MNANMGRLSYVILVGIACELAKMILLLALLLEVQR
jgi:hypothetical protein